MKAVILAAGWGTRLRPFTHTLPKHLLPLAGKPLIRHVLAMVREAGLTEVGLVVSPATLELFRESLGDKEGLRITYILQPEPKGLAHAVLCAEGFVGNEDFLVVLGDNLLGEGLGPALGRFEKEGTHTVVLAAVEDPRRFGVAVVEDGRILKLVEKPKDPPSPWAVVGVYVFRPSLFAAARKIRPSFRGELELTDAIQRLVEEGEPVCAHFLSGWWQDVGRPADLLVAQARLFARLSPRVEGELDANTRLQGQVVIERGARVRNSHLEGPVWVGHGAEVDASVLGPNVAVGPKAQVQNARLRNAILMDEARVEGVSLGESVLGRRAHVRGKGQASLFLGDDAWVELEGGNS